MPPLLAAGILWLLVLLPQAAASVVISEVLYDPAGSDAGNESLELYNPTGAAVNLTGWIVEMGNGNTSVWSIQATLNGNIPAYGFYLIGGWLVNGTDFQKNLTLQNGPDAVRIRDGQREVDKLG